MIAAARIPITGLAQLAPLRADASVRVRPEECYCWIRWPESRIEIVDQLRPITGIEFLEFRSPHWYRPGELLPSSLVPPSGDWDSVDRHLFPDSLTVARSNTEPIRAIELSLVSGGEPQSATAMICTLDEFRNWVEFATTWELSSLRAATSGNRVLILGSRLPVIANSERFYGESVLVPLGFGIHPQLPESFVRQSHGANDKQLLIVSHEGAFTVERSILSSITRSGVRRVTG